MFGHTQSGHHCTLELICKFIANGFTKNPYEKPLKKEPVCCYSTYSTWKFYQSINGCGNLITYYLECDELK